MKAVNVNVLLQFDHFEDEGEVTEGKVKMFINILNQTLSSIHADSQPELVFNDESTIQVIQLDEEEDENF